MWGIVFGRMSLEGFIETQCPFSPSLINPPPGEREHNSLQIFRQTLLSSFPPKWHNISFISSPWYSDGALLSCIFILTWGCWGRPRKSYSVLYPEVYVSPCSASAFCVWALCIYSIEVMSSLSLYLDNLIYLAISLEYLVTLSLAFLILLHMSSSSPPQPQNWLEYPLTCRKCFLERAETPPKRLSYIRV